MRAASLVRWLAVAAVVLAPGRAVADVVTEWNERALASAMHSQQFVLVASRTMAIVHAAMFDAVNSIEARYTPYRAKVPAAAGSSADAAAAAAAHAVLTEIFPGQRAQLDAALSAALAKIADGGKEAGVSVGERAAAEILALRASDGSAAPSIYRPYAAPGVYVPTTLPVGSQWGNVTPWIMERGSQFRPGPPPQLASQGWARDYNEVKELGGKKSGVRSAEQTDIGRFWTIVGPAAWDPVVRQFASAPGRSVAQNARLFALVEMATADAYVAVFDAKYAFNFWRPITAIRNGDLDGNDATERDPAWEPLIDTPLHPEYPCAHCITSAAVGVILESEFGGGPIPVVTLTSAAAPGVVRRWTTIQQYVDEVSAARIYGGVHYRTSAEVGRAMGRSIGRRAVQNYLNDLR